MPDTPQDEQRAELATLDNDPNRLFGGTALRRPDDEVLRKQGKAHLLEIYRDLKRDPQVQMALDKRISAVTEKEWTVEPGRRQGMEPTAEDRRIADLAEAQLKALGEEETEREHASAQLPSGFRHLVEGLLDAVLLGFQVAEVVWDVQGSETVAESVKLREERRFRFDNDNRLRLRTQSNMLPGRLLPPRKFVVHQFGSKTDPYGRGLGHQLYWPVFFKRQDMSFWLRFLDKHGGPTAIGKHRQGLDPDSEEVKSLRNALKSVHTDSAITIPEDQDIEFLEVASKASSADSYQDLKDAMDTAIVKSILGVTLTTDLDGQGSYAATETHQDEQQRLARADARLVDHSLNQTLMRWLTRYNSDTAVPPRVMHEFPDLGDRQELSTILVNLGKVGFRPSGDGATDWINTKFAGGEEVFEEVSIMQAPQGGGQAPLSMDETTEPLPAWQVAEGLLPYVQAAEPDEERTENLEVVADYTQRLEDRAEDVFADMLGQIDEELQEADGIGEAVRRIDELYPELDSDELAEAMSTGLLAAHGAGRVEMDAESDVRTQN